MRSLKTLLLTLFLFAILYSCEQGTDIDKEKPVISFAIKDAFPMNCDTIYFGETFIFKVLFMDNAALGSKNAFSLDIHNNFNHHSHTTEITECNLSPEIDPVNPFLFIENYDIPTGLVQYETNLEITIPSGNDDGLFDEGDYHLYIRLSDKEAWSSQKGLSIKMLHR